jgi:hypothetical protein
MMRLARSKASNGALAANTSAWPLLYRRLGAPFSGRALRGDDQQPAELIDPAEGFNIEYFPRRSDKHMDGIGHDAAAVSGAIGKCPLRRKEDAIPAIVAMTKRALDFVNFGFSRLQRPIELTAMFAKQILPVKGTDGSARAGRNDWERICCTRLTFSICGASGQRTAANPRKIDPSCIGEVALISRLALSEWFSDNQLDYGAVSLPKLRSNCV